MSETPNENPDQVTQPGAGEPQPQERATPQTPPQPSTSAATTEQEFAIRLVKRETGDVHWNVANGVWEKITHAETGEPNSEYVLLASIDGVDVPLAAYNAGRVETVVRSQRQVQQPSGS